MSVFRRLQEVGYLSSFTHSGRYYTLTDIPEFDEHGLWFHQGVGFSRIGTLKGTVVDLVEGADAGKTHPELESLVRVRVHNTLLELLRERRIGRERLDRLYLYVSANETRAAEQVDRRHQVVATGVDEAEPLPVELVIAVLVEALHASEGLASGAVVAARLSARGQGVTAEQVEHVYAEFQLVPGKKRRSHARNTRVLEELRSEPAGPLLPPDPQHLGDPGGRARGARSLSTM
ncbi:MAG: hypothetical protein HY816_00705 [Candidatus Wallbacteria bacterium]|nr:hypothetical protein [Candidatus Wallbacteria bacterium]